MGMQINIGDHVSPRAGYQAFSGAKQDTVRWARTRARAIAAGMPSADTYFKTLPAGRTLSNILADSSIWVNYHATSPYFGEAEIGGKELMIGIRSFRVGRWTVLATLIHELAHIGGAPTGVSRLAEEALLHCGLGKMSEFNSGVDDPKTPYMPGNAGAG